MELKKRNYFAKSLNFRPVNSAETLGLSHAAFDILFAGFDLEHNQEVIDHGQLSSEEFLKLWTKLYPQLSTMEKIRLFHCLQDFQNSTLSEILKTHYNFESQFYQRSFKLNQLDEEIQNWLIEKCFGANEIDLLLEFNLDELNAILTKSIENKDTRQIATTRFELIQELTGMNHNLYDLILKDIDQLKSLRFPMTLQRDQEFASKVKNWPSKIRAKTQRRGDIVGFDLNFFVSSPGELEKYSEQLKKVATEWISNQQNP